MKSVYSSLVAIVVFVVLAPLAIADPGTTWGNTINGPDRFQVLSGFGGGAVLDQETGRVWELSPSTSPMSSTAAFTHCYQLEVGGRKGWRLPTIEELASLVDASQPAPTLPAGHPFSNVQTSKSTECQFGGCFYWSVTTSATLTLTNPINIRGVFPWGVNFGNGDVATGALGGDNFVWCVRGGQGINFRTAPGAFP